MKARWHWLWSLSLTGLAFWSVRTATGQDVVAAIAAIAVFVLYWIGWAVFVFPDENNGGSGSTGRGGGDDWFQW